MSLKVFQFANANHKKGGSHYLFRWGLSWFVDLQLNANYAVISYCLTYSRNSISHGVKSILACESAIQYISEGSHLCPWNAGIIEGLTGPWKPLACSISHNCISGSHGNPKWAGGRRLRGWRVGVESWRADW